MAIAKIHAATAQIIAAPIDEVNEIEALLDARIAATRGMDVHVYKEEWLTDPPSDAVLEALKAKYEAPGMGWTLTVQPDRNGPIIWLK